MFLGRLSMMILAAIGVFMLLSCSPSEPEPPKDATILHGAGATFPAPLYKEWISAYQKAHPDIVVDYEAVGSGEGIQRFMSESVDFGASDAAMSDEQIAQVARGVRLIPATAGIIVLAYNVAGVSELKLPRDVYADIFLGRINKWNDPRIQAANPDATLPNLNIVIVARQDSSGTTYAFTNHLSAVSPEWRDRGPGTGKLVDWPGNAMVARGNGGVAGRIKISEGSIGYVEFGFARRAGLRMATLENRSGNFVPPVAGSGTATLRHHETKMPDNLRIFFPDPEGEASYPIVTYSWIMLYERYPDAQKWAALRSFIEWGLSEGQAISEEIGYCRLPEAVAELAMNATAEIQ